MIRESIVASLFVVLAGCSAEPPPSGSGATGDLAPPKLEEIVKMASGLHVTWTNSASTCDSIEGERKATKADGSLVEDYKVAFTVPGAADNKHDGTATEPVTYSYRLRCKRGETYSAYSNELSGSPN